MKNQHENQRDGTVKIFHGDRMPSGADYGDAYIPSQWLYIYNPSDMDQPKPPFFIRREGYLWGWDRFERGLDLYEGMYDALIYSLKLSIVDTYTPEEVVAIKKAYLAQCKRDIELVGLKGHGKSWFENIAIIHETMAIKNKADAIRAQTTIQRTPEFDALLAMAPPATAP